MSLAPILTRACSSSLVKARPAKTFAIALTLRQLPNTIYLYHSHSTCAEQRVGTRTSMTSLEELRFDNRAIKSLPVEEERENYTRSVSGACFSYVSPTPLRSPTLVAYSQPGLDLLGLSPDQVCREEFVAYFSGNVLLPGSEPASHCYCGHQFGHFSGQLGDGCAHYLGEIVSQRGERWELQLKGSGKTPYSRFADGRKVLRSSIREFLCSEAMHFLGVPTTRAGTCITSEDTVTRDINYNGNPIQEKCTVISRIAPTFLRFGSFEIFKTRDRMTGRVGPSVGRVDILDQLLDFTTQNYYPQVHSLSADDRSVRAAAFFKELCQRTARLVALWQCIGFCHGVLNTDNMSIIGLTIDYGPYGFMDRYNPGHICNGSDNGGRYAYDQQPSVSRWNMEKLAEALAPYLTSDRVKEGLEHYDAEFEKQYLSRMRQKLGLLKKALPEDTDLIESFLDTMHKTGCDFTNGFRCLSHVPTAGGTGSDMEEVVEHFIKECTTPQQLLAAIQPKMPPHQLHMFIQLMQQAPEVLQALGMSADTLKMEIIKMEQADKLKDMSAEEKRVEDRALWTSWLTKYTQRLQLEVAGEDEEVHQQRLVAMQESNPRFILRNHLLQTAIQQAEKGDFSEVHQLLRLVQSPYSDPSPPIARSTVAGEGGEQGGEREAGNKEEGGEEEEKPKVEVGVDGEEERVEEVAAVAASVSSSGLVRAETSQYYSNPPDWALGLIVT